MRTFHWNAPIIIGAGGLALLVLAPAPSLPAQEQPVISQPVISQPVISQPASSQPAELRPAQTEARTVRASVPGTVLETVPDGLDEAQSGAASLAELRERLDSSDRHVAMKALNIALREVGDGATLTWRRPERNIMGVIEPVSAYMDEQGRICRTVRYSITLGDYAKEIEGSLCRNKDGNWVFSG